MPTREALKMSITVDHILKFLIAGLVSLLTFIGNDLMKSVEKLETGFDQMQQSITELKIEVKHLAGRDKTAMTSPIGE